MKLNFWFLDINQEVVEGHVEMWIWGIDETGRRILIIDRDFKPSIYLLPRNNKTYEITKWVKSLGVEEVRVEDKKYFGSHVKAVKTSTGNVEKLKKICDEVSKGSLIKEVLHDDIRPSSLYLIEYDVKPCGWHSVEVEEIKNFPKAKVEKVYLAKSKPVFYEKFEYPKLRILTFYPVYYTAIGSPHPERDPILVISVNTSDGEKRTFRAVDADDGNLLKEFINYIQQYDPDLIVGYNSNRVHIPYFLQRSKKLGVDFLIDRASSEPHQSVYGHISVTGRLHVDLYEIVEDIPEVKVKTLENFAEYLGFHKNLEVVRLRETDIYKCWMSEKEKVIKFCEYCAMLIKRISDSMLDYVFQLSNLVGIPADYVFSAAVGFRVDWYLIRKAFTYNELIPKRVEQEYYTYKGGMVLEPKPGIHENIAVFDFSSMYPSLMVKYNLSPDTYVKPDEKFDGEVYVAPEVNHKFKVNPPGFYKQVLLELMDARRRIQEKLKKLSYDTPLYKVLDARQRRIK
ncbi:MAG: DNA polymerase II, partial [Candidatus Bathyarchaeota archaeon]|nr:DNA polymerase II [Candidatus Bathyarchaeota archaeon]